MRTGEDMHMRGWAAGGMLSRAVSRGPLAGEPAGSPGDGACHVDMDSGPIPPGYPPLGVGATQHHSHKAGLCPGRHIRLMGGLMRSYC